MLPAPPQLLNQEPPRPQQLGLPDFTIAPHLGHSELTVVVVVSASVFMYIGQDTKEKHSQQSLFSLCGKVVSLQLTLAGRHALEPLVINIFVADTSAVLKPGTARSAATLSAGFLKRAAFGARRRFCYC